MKTYVEEFPILFPVKSDIENIVEKCQSEQGYAQQCPFIILTCKWPRPAIFHMILDQGYFFFKIQKIETKNNPKCSKPTKSIQITW